MVLLLEVLDGTLLLSVLLHQSGGLLFKLLVDWHVLFAVSQALIVEVLCKEIVLDLDESLIAYFFDLTLKVVVLLFKFFDVLVLDL